jgi:hypothetical protein
MCIALPRHVFSFFLKNIRVALEFLCTKMHKPSCVVWMSRRCEEHGVKDEETERPLTERELALHVLFAMLRLPVGLASELQIQLKELSEWSETAYFYELRSRGLKMREISEELDISMRKAAQLSKQLKERFFEATRQSLARRIEFMLWAEPMSLVRVQQALSEEEPEAVVEALGVLVSAGRVIEQPGRVTSYAIASRESRQVRSSWVAKIDGLNQLLSTVSHAVRARLFRGDERAMVRNLQLRIRPEDIPQLKALYEEVIWERLRLLDERAAACEDAVPLNFAICWAPEPETDKNSDGDE